MLKYPFFNTVSKVINFCLSAFFYSVLFIRLRSEDFAVFAQISIGFSFLSILDFGSNLSITKGIGKEDGGSKLRSVECFYILISAFIYLVLLVTKDLQNTPKHNWGIFFEYIHLLVPIFIFKLYQVLYLNSLLGLREMKSHFGISTLHSFVSTLVVLIFLEIFGYSLLVLLLSLMISYGAVLFVSLVVVWSKLNETFLIKPDFRFYTDNLSFNRYITLNSLLGILLSNLDKYFVLTYLTLDQLSLYTLTSKIVTPISVVYTSFGQGLLSPLSELWSRGLKREFYSKSFTSSRVLLLVLLIVMSSIFLFSKFYFYSLNINENDILFATSLCCLLGISLWFNAIASTLIYSSISLGDSKNQFLMNLIVGPFIITLFWIFHNTSVFSVFYLMVLQNFCYILVYLRLVRNQYDFDFQRAYIALILKYSLIAILIVLYFWKLQANLIVDILVYILLVFITLRELGIKDFLNYLIVK